MMPITIGTARTGRPTAAAGTVRIHSSYDPEKEAFRFVDSLDDDIGRSGITIVIGAGLGYLDMALRKKRESTAILAIHLDDALYEARIASESDDSGTVRWHPGSGESITSFLSRTVEELDVTGLRTVEWPPSVEVLQEPAQEVREALSAVIRLHSGNISATAAFGRHWIRNLLRNGTELGNMAVPKPVDGPVVLAASGPSLEEALPSLLRFRDRFSLWALPSSVCALQASGLVPDLIFATDPGFWARLHIRFFATDVPVAMPLSAAPLPERTGPVMVIPQGIPGEKELLGADWPLLPLPEMGTVAATALEAWKELGRGSLLLVGLDLSWTDLRSHARPHGFDGWIGSGVCRTRPALTIAWERRRTAGSALRTYADWFVANAPGNRVNRFRSRNARTEMTDIPGIPTADEEWFDTLDTEGPPLSGPNIVESPWNRSRRKQAAADLTAGWRKLFRNAPESPEARRLAYILDPGGALDIRRRTDGERSAAEERHRNRVERILEGLARTGE